MRRPFFYLSLGILLVAGARGAAIPRPSGAVIPFAPRPLPQRAAADFDADGRPDLAVIRDTQGLSRVWITLSGSNEAVALGVNAVSVVGGDIDHDGDVDLVTATSSNEIVIWRNDGHGHFTEEAPLPSRDLSPAPTTGLDGSREEPMAVGPTAPHVVGAGRLPDTAVVGTRVRPPSGPFGVALSVLTLPSLRGPPFAPPLT